MTDSEKFFFVYLVKSIITFVLAVIVVYIGPSRIVSHRIVRVLHTLEPSSGFLSALD